jgi:large subunit ribosomal protein L18
MKLSKDLKRKRIHKRIRKSVKGTAGRPRLNVYRSNSNIYCQLIDDVNGRTIIATSSKDTALDGFKGTNCEISKEVGKIIGQKAIETGIQSVVFDRGGYLYHGRVKALADGARESGLQF